MLDVHMTDHAEVRKQQRGFRNADIDLLLSLGEPCGCDGYRVSHQTAQNEIARLKAQIQHIERLAGSIAVVCEGSGVTVHHGENPKSNRRRRKGESHGN
ncbi:hypothetical protein A9Q95_15670 [Rhodobacterales bacterium 59_46_T64]|nr:hypothetical protein A9Q95_15670 [Rhodobacterales bacterium 59_46_T64]